MWEGGEMDGGATSEMRREDGSHQNKKQRSMGTERVTLYDLSLERSSFVLPQVAHKLRCLPDDFAVPVVLAFLGRVPGPSVKELRDFCVGVDWVPQRLSLCGMPESRSMRVLHVVALPNLVRVDLSGCVWIENLDFLSGLKCLECLILRGCWRLTARELHHIRELPRLQCLDVENIPAVDDVFSATLLGLTRLRALNVNFTFVSDYLVEVLTYGNRLRADLGSQQQAAASSSHEVQTLLSQYPSSNLTYFRFQGTRITGATIAHLQAISDLQLLDVCQVKNMTGGSFSSLKAKHKLVALPNRRFLAARTNAMLAGVLKGECGCRAMAPQDEVIDEFTNLCQEAYCQFVNRPGVVHNNLDISMLPCVQASSGTKSGARCRHSEMEQPTILEIGGRSTR